MRPVNLIPPDERRGGSAATRSGPLAYIVVMALALGVGAVSLTVLAGNKVADKKGQVAELEQQTAATGAKAQQLQGFADFRTVQEQRTVTVASLAQSRFDWERVLSEFSRVLPSDVWLTAMSGSVAPGFVTDGGVPVAGREDVLGPALELAGCGAGQEAVAGFVSRLEDIDGVTRVGVESSALPDGDLNQTAAPATGGSSPAVSDDCRTRDFISEFKIVVAFDEAVVPAISATVPSAPVMATPSAPVNQAQAQTVTGQADPEDVTRNSINTVTKKGHRAVKLITGG